MERYDVDPFALYEIHPPLEFLSHTTEPSLARPNRDNCATNNEIENVLHGTHDYQKQKLEPKRKGKRPVETHSRYHP